MRSYDAIVIGGGAVGASTFFELSRRGMKKALILEKKDGYGRGSTGSWGSLIRVWHMNSRTTDWASESVPHYLNFQDLTGRKNGYVKTGSLYFLNRKRFPSLEEQFSLIQSRGLKISLLNAIEGKKQFPDFQWHQEDFAIYEDYAGYTCPWQTTSGWIEAAVDKGFDAETDREMVDIRTEGNRVTGIITDKGETIPCGQLVLATGAWTPHIVSKLDEALPIKPKMIQVNQFKRANQTRKNPFFLDMERRTFGRPAPDGSFLGGYVPTEFQNPKQFVQPLSLEVAHEAKRLMAMRLNWLKNATLTGGIRAVEGYTEDLNGILRFSTRFSNLFISAGWSCCGFTLAPAIAKRSAEMLGGAA